MNADTRLIPVMRFCGQCSCGCPELFLDPDAPEERRVVITDDFGQRIQMSLDQLRDILEQAKSGALEEALLATR
ncbi:hypothetical protein C3Y87_13655 [Carbonactinospora thermoautotrophica]|uniref:YD repeat (Two copies) n=1 Tax=Carbonactinospora thermoautotrophica TaxID=1469144 RepID=A0A132N1W9_9ACTN|nr:hypothetical protein [Carbonactinospora thermoautotrophica]KWX04129.1 YD repeat (two copies) [Carbonactinospora thermoautotrophica]KWX06637.1 YD repeat (two copies) [Carbonactinospora thermoautotrophica]MCX9192439.1 hypothetical protein [Carbonactinospora thermoautotrophica]